MEHSFGEIHTRIGVISAFGKESKTLRLRLKEISRNTIDGRLCFFLRYGDEEIIVVRSGLGKKRGAAAAQLLIDHFNPRAIINCGVAGAISPKRRIGDVVVSEHVLEYDSPDVKDSPEMVFHPDESLVRAAVRVSQQTIREGMTVAGIILSGDATIASRKRKDELWNRFHGQCVEQESAGVARVCQRHNIPWIAIRGISDSADENALRDFDKNVSTAAENACLVTFELVKVLSRRSLPLDG